MNTRRCSWCGEQKPLTEYSAKVTTRTGLSGVCKACEKPAPAAMPETVVQSMCGKKRRYPDRGRALEVAVRAAHRAELLRVYECPICHGFHLTHTKARRR